ncbi:hypothetical protein H5410_021486 [Solanum commersonii]|uniref:Uncharacterized protein n=1 Tax=Solanum commersonii TaxID=4109 RepID=A0A9J5ZCR1_SOLCO|nr:hypothetical protein H5410_021486 [Solanum commersonii]
MANEAYNLEELVQYQSFNQLSVECKHILNTDKARIPMLRIKTRRIENAGHQHEHMQKQKTITTKRLTEMKRKILIENTYPRAQVSPIDYFYELRKDGTSATIVVGVDNHNKRRRRLRAATWELVGSSK